MPTLDVSPAITALGLQSVVVTHRDPETYGADGMVADGEPAEVVTVKGSLQPASGKDLKVLPEGETVTEALVFFTSAELRPRAGANPGDRVGIMGRGNFSVVGNADWMDVGGYRKFLLVREP